jgi:hypothetical protein
MKKLLIFLVLFMFAMTAVSGAETVLLSGNPISLEILSAAAATELADSLTATHADLTGRAADIADTLHDAHSNLFNFIKVARDTTTATHTDLTTRAKLLADSLTATHSRTETIGKALSDTLTATHSRMETLGKALGDTLTATHADLTGRAADIADTLTATHANILDLVLTETTAIEDTLTDVHSSVKSFETAITDSLTDTHSRLETISEDLKTSVTADSTTNEATNAVADKIVAATGVLFEQADAAINVTALSDSGTTVLNLRTVNTRYVVRNLRLKSADPGANTVTVKLYEFINDVFVAVDSFEITTLNFATYFNLYDLFGETQLAGDNLWITVETDAGTAAITGQYSFAKTSN